MSLLCRRIIVIPLGQLFSCQSPTCRVKRVFSRLSGEIVAKMIEFVRIT